MTLTWLWWFLGGNVTGAIIILFVAKNNPKLQQWLFNKVDEYKKR